MPTYSELIQKYKKRQHDTVVDAVTAGLSYADNIVMDLGLMEDSGVLSEALTAAGTVLPFAVIAITEGYKVVVRKKSPTAAAQDTAFRTVKTGAALGVGAAATLAAGPILAIPAAVTTRVLLDRIKSKALVNKRVLYRTQRLKNLQRAIAERQLPAVSAEPLDDRALEILLSKEATEALPEEMKAVSLPFIPVAEKETTLDP